MLNRASWVYTLRLVIAEQTVVEYGDYPPRSGSNQDRKRARKSASVKESPSPEPTAPVAGPILLLCGVLSWLENSIAFRNVHVHSDGSVSRMRLTVTKNDYS